jgi:hypothetical protein
MAEDPGSLQQQVDGAEDLPYRLLERAPSEYTKAVIVNEKLVPWIQKKGISRQIDICSAIITVTRLSTCHFWAVPSGLANTV